MAANEPTKAEIATAIVEVEGWALSRAKGIRTHLDRVLFAAKKTLESPVTAVVRAPAPAPAPTGNAPPPEVAEPHRRFVTSFTQAFARANEAFEPANEALEASLGPPRRYISTTQYFTSNDWPVHAPLDPTRAP